MFKIRERAPIYNSTTGKCIPNWICDKMRIVHWNFIKLNILKLFLLSTFFFFVIQLVIYFTNMSKCQETGIIDIVKKHCHDNIHVSREHSDGISTLDKNYYDDIHIVEKNVHNGIHIVEKTHHNGIHIVEEHHHVWPIWKRHTPPAVVHIDAHPDLAFNSEDIPDRNDVFIYLGTREKWLKTVIWIWPMWDANGPRHWDTTKPVTKYTGYWGIRKTEELGGLWTSNKLCICEGRNTECFNMDDDLIENSACYREEGTEFEVIIVSTDYVIENPGWLKKTLGGQAFILDIDLDHAAAINNPMKQSLDKAIQIISHLIISPLFSRSLEGECEFHERMMKEMGRIVNCNATNKTLADQILCLTNNPEGIQKKITESGFCVKGKIMQVCTAQGSPDISPNWQGHFNQSLADLERLVSMVYQENTPIVVTICRSVRDGYTPAALAPVIEATVIHALETNGTKHVFYDQQLWCGPKGPGL